MCFLLTQHLACIHPRRALWLMVTGQPWSQEEHRHFPPAFKAAVRTLLALLPTDVLVKLVIPNATFPLSVWLPE